MNSSTLCASKCWRKSNMREHQCSPTNTVFVKFAKFRNLFVRSVCSCSPFPNKHVCSCSWTLCSLCSSTVFAKLNSTTLSGNPPETFRKTKNFYGFRKGKYYAWITFKTAQKKGSLHSFYWRRFLSTISDLRTLIKSNTLKNKKWQMYSRIEMRRSFSLFSNCLLVLNLYYAHHWNLANRHENS